jgi:hypothetical protein
MMKKREVQEGRSPLKKPSPLVGEGRVRGKKNKSPLQTKDLRFGWEMVWRGWLASGETGEVSSEESQIEDKRVESDE